MYMHVHADIYVYEHVQNLLRCHFLTPPISFHASDSSHKIIFQHMKVAFTAYTKMGG